MRVRLFLVLAAIAAVAAAGTPAAGSAAATDWPNFRYDVQRDGNDTGESIISGPGAHLIAQRWASTNVNPGTTYAATFSSAAVSGTNAYVGSGDSSLISLDMGTGTQRWRFALSTMKPVDSSPAVGSINGVATVYFGDTGDTVYAVSDVTTGPGAPMGRLAWESDPVSGPKGPILGSPVLSGGELYVGSADGNLYAFNAASGHVDWTYTTGGPVDSSPAVDPTAQGGDGLVVFGSYDDNVYAVDLTTHHLVWSVGTGGTVIATPAISGGYVYVGSRSGSMLKLAEATGSVAWDDNLSAPIESSAAVADGEVFVATTVPNDTFYALDDSTGLRRWTFTSPIRVELSAINSPVHSSPAVADGVVFFGSFDGFVYGLDVNGNGSGGSLTLLAYNTNPNTSPNNQPNQQGPIFVDASPAISNGNIVVPTHDVQLGVVDLVEPAPTLLTYNGALSTECSDKTVFSATLTNSATGQPLGNQLVQFQITGFSQPFTVTTSSSGVASLSVAPVTSGNLSVTVSYNGTALYQAAAPVTTSVSSALDESSLTYTGGSTGDAGQLVAVSAHASDADGPIPGQSVQFTIGTDIGTAVTDANGDANGVVRLTNETPGPYSVTASLPGGGCWQTASASAPMNVQQTPVSLHYTGPTALETGDVETLSASLLVNASGPNQGVGIPGEILTFNLGGQTVTSAPTDGNGHTSVTLTPNEAAGNYQLSIAFAGDTDNTPCSVGAQIAVDPDATITSYTGTAKFAFGTASPVSAVFRDATAGDPQPPSGAQITFKIFDANGNFTGDVATAFTDANGNASAALTPLAPGSVPGSALRLVAGYAGGPYLAESDTTTDIQMNPGTPTLTYTGPSTGTNDGSNVSLTATLYGPAGASEPIVGRTVVFSFGQGNPTFSARTDATGLATATQPLNMVAGPYTLTVGFAGDSYWNGAIVRAPFTVSGIAAPTQLQNCAASPYTILGAESVNFSAKLVNTLDPTHAMASLPVAVDITDVTGHTLYVTSSATTDAMGNIGTTLGPLSLAQGEYAVTASYTGQTGVFGPSGCSVTFWVANFQYNFVDMNPANGAGHYRVRLDPADKLFLFEVCDPSGGMVFPNPHDPCPAPPAQQQSFFVAATPQQFNHVTSNTPSPQSPPTDNMDYINYQSAGNGPTQFSLTGAFDEATHSFTADATYNGTRAVAMRADCSDSVLPGGTANYCSN